ncbi:MAG: TetR/AcrR family transcriptional regulator [Roseateles sp.]|uniref:TetR/AcrR family transcriptional regulator n=1 Tax=Roseateles sp. TaxID=1971397 RepID=UPI0039ED0971
MPTTPTPKRPRPTRSDAQRQAILDAASLLFIEKGFAGTNINDIADAVGTTRTALYYYFPSKEAMLEVLTEEVTEKASALAQSVSGRDELPADEALRLLIEQHAGLILSHPVQFRVVERSESSLPEPHRTAAQGARRALLNHFMRVIQRGIDGGQFRRGTDARIAAFSIIGMCNWSAWWFDSRGETPADVVAGTIADFGLRLLRPDKARRAQAVGIEDAVGQMREALEVFEAEARRANRR